MITIINMVASRGTKRQLANIALVSKRMYEIAIPKLYGCIEVTELNHDELTFGCTPTFSTGSDGTSHFANALMSSRRRCICWTPHTQGSRLKAHPYFDPPRQPSKAGCSMLSEREERDIGALGSNNGDERGRVQLTSRLLQFDSGILVRPIA
jgi:hypothetical protein